MAACQQANSLTAVPATQSAATLAPIPTAEPTALPTTGAKSSPLGASALVLDWKNTDGRATLFPISSDTGKPLPGYPPVDFGLDSQYAFTPDRKSLVYITSGPKNCWEECLHMLDLSTWKESIQPVVLSDNPAVWVANPAFGPQGNTLAVVLNDQSHTSGKLVLVDLLQGKLLKSLDLSSTTFLAGSPAARRKTGARN